MGTLQERVDELRAKAAEARKAPILTRAQQVPLLIDELADVLSAIAVKLDALPDGAASEDVKGGGDGG